MVKSNNENFNFIRKNKKTNDLYVRLFLLALS